MPASFKIIGIGLLLLLIGFFWGIQDIRMKWSGRKTMATITDATESSNGIVRVNYMFSDDAGLDHEGFYTADHGWRPPLDMKVLVVHLPGKPESVRLASDLGIMGIWIFLSGAGLTALGFYVFNRETVNQAHAQMRADDEDSSDPIKKLKRATRLIR